MEKIWVKNYPPGVPETIHYDQYHSLAEAFEHYAQQYKDHTVVRNFNVDMSYLELDRKSYCLACYLQQRLQLKKGDRIALMLPNVMQHPIALFAALRLGLIIVNVNPFYTADELTRLIKDSGAQTIIVLENFMQVVAQSRVHTDLQNIIVTRIGDCLGFKGLLLNFFIKYVRRLVPKWHMPDATLWKTMVSQGKAAKALLKPAIQRDDIAFLQYTGGTTGIPKGAMLTHGNLLANTTQALTWVRSALTEAEEVVLTALPLYHIFSLTVCLLSFTNIGSRCLFITNPKDIAQLIKTMRQDPPTVFVGLETLFHALLEHPDFQTLNFSKLKLVIAGGMPTKLSTIKRWKAVTGRPILEGYGLTEASPIVSINLPENAVDGSVGLPISSTEVSIRNESGEALPLLETGEIWVRGPQVMKGYWNHTMKSAELTEEGWLCTGDMGKMDAQGFLYIVDRKKDMILVSGFNVYPCEVEDVIQALPQVNEVSVVGEPSDQTGERVVAYIIKEPGVSLSEQDILTDVREHLAAYKVPKKVQFVESFPRSTIGKVLKRELRRP